LAIVSKLGGKPMKLTINSEQAPKAVGPYSQAIQFGNLLFISGQLGLDTAGQFVGTDVTSQTRQSLDNLKAILAAAGYSMADVVKATIFLADMNDFGVVNGIYQEYFTAPYPARACVQVARLPKDGLVEIEVIAARE
jgi:2-iminobutanoate/2-iminopropanoate deaminase